VEVSLVIVLLLPFPLGEEEGVVEEEVVEEEGVLVRLRPIHLGVVVGLLLLEAEAADPIPHHLPMTGDEEEAISNLLTTNVLLEAKKEKRMLHPNHYLKDLLKGMKLKKKKHLHPDHPLLHLNGLLRVRTRNKKMLNYHGRAGIKTRMRTN